MNTENTSKLKTLLDELNVEVEIVKDWETAKGMVRPRLVQPVKDWWLDGKVHRYCANLPVIYFIPLGENENGGANVIVTDSLLSVWGVNEQTLYDVALNNLKSETAALLDIINDLAKQTGNTTEDAVDYADFDREMVTVITTDDHNYGAAAILDENVLKGVYNAFGGECILCPSSVHEWITFPAACMAPEAARLMVRQINFACVNNDDKLSDDVYLYNPTDGFRVWTGEE